MTTTCPRCKDIGFFLLDRDYGEPGFCELHTCHCRQVVLDREREERLRTASNLVGALLRKSFANFNTPRPAQRQALAAARKYAGRPAGWLVLVGANGCGKTHLAAAIANDRLANRHPVLFVVVPDLLDHLRSTYAPNSPIRYDERFDQVRAHPLLILDDLGAESSTPWAAEKLYRIINHRYNAELPTMITTNLMMPNLPLRLGVRIRDASLSKIVHVDVASDSSRADSPHYTEEVLPREMYL